MSFWDTPAKDVPRQIVMQSRRKVAKTALTLPGDKMLCVKAGFVAGVFNHHTQHIFVERDEKLHTRIAREMGKLDCEWEPRFWRDELCKMPLRSLLDNVPLDFAYLDLCAALNGRIARWIFTELSQSLADNATVAVTLSRNYRASKFMRWWANYLKKSRLAHNFWLATEKKIFNSDCAGIVGDLGDYYDDSVMTAADGYMLPARGKSKWNRLLQPEYHNPSVDALSAFALLLPYYDFKLKACVEYRRNPQQNTGHWMTTYVLSDLTKLEKPVVPRGLIKALGQNLSPQLNPLSMRML